MKKVVLLTVAVLLVASVGFATDTRVTTMGGIPDFLIDDVNMFHFPAWVNNYTGNIIVEFGEGYYKDNYYYGRVGGYFHTAYGNWGVLVGQTAIPSAVYDAMWEGDYYKDGDPYYYLCPKLDVIYGTDFGDMDFGFRFEWIGGGYTQDNDPEGDENDNTLSVGGLRAGASVMYPLGDDSWVDFAVHYGMYNWEYNAYGEAEDKLDPEYTFSDDGTMAFDVNARAFIPMGHLTLIPTLLFNMSSAKWQYDYPATDDYPAASGEHSSMFFGGGLGWNWQPEDSYNIIFGVLGGIERYTEAPDDTLSYEREWSYMYYPAMTFVFGGEANIWPWLGGRINFWKEVYTYDYTRTRVSPDDYYKYSTSYCPYGVGTGLWVTFGNWTFDFEVNTDSFFKGLYFINGIEHNPFCSVSTTWNFPE